jgi:hypothetical protein
MKGLPNFPLEFNRIGNYLAHAPNASKHDLKVAKAAFKKIVETIYGAKEHQVDGCGRSIPVVRIW